MQVHIHTKIPSQDEELSGPVKEVNLHRRPVSWPAGNKYSVHVTCLYCLLFEELPKLKVRYCTADCGTICVETENLSNWYVSGIPCHQPQRRRKDILIGGGHSLKLHVE